MTGVGGREGDSRIAPTGEGDGRVRGEKCEWARPRFLAGPRNDKGVRGRREDPARDPLSLRLVQGERKPLRPNPGDGFMPLRTFGPCRSTGMTVESGLGMKGEWGRGEGVGCERCEWARPRFLAEPRNDKVRAGP